MYLPPLGEGFSLNAAKKSFEFMAKVNASNPISAVLRT